MAGEPATLPPYSRMIDSGVSWLGEIPEHWSTTRSRFLFREVDVRSEGGSETHLSMSQRLGLVTSSEAGHSTLASESNVGGKLVQPDDLVLNRLKAHLGVFARATQAGVISPDYTVLRPRRQLAVRYYEEALRSPACRQELYTRTKGIVEGFWRLYTDDFYDVRLPEPPAGEQEAIVRFLSYTDQQVRRYIRAKQKLIKLLEEQKQAIVHRAVTRGVDPNGRLKPSGVEWLGDIPEHWDVRALRARYTQALGKMLDSKRVTGDYPLPYLRNTDVQWDRVNTKDLPTMDIAPSEYERYTVRSGDLLVCEGGEVGRCAIWIETQARYGYQKALHRLRPIRRNVDCPRYMYYALRAATIRHAFDDGHVSTIPHLTGDKLRAHRFAFPPAIEQKRIVEYLDQRLRQIDLAREGISEDMALVREYRTRLIADVVTGKLDVREAAARLPEEIDEVEKVDDVEATDDTDVDMDTDVDGETEGAGV
jgi:type I restriction enzyme S subunit